MQLKNIITKKHLATLGINTDEPQNVSIYFMDSMGEIGIPNTKPIIQVHRVADMMPTFILEEFATQALNLENRPGHLMVRNFEDTDLAGLDITVFDMYTNHIEVLIQFIEEFEYAVMTEFGSAGGDDSTFDYIPAYYYLLEDLYRALRLPAQHGIDFRRRLYEIDPEYPEFFTDEELNDFSKQ